jgi:hypothetical protein
MLTDQRRPYEILIRFDEEGAVQGAHLVERRVVELDGERLKDEVGTAQPIALAFDGGGRAALSDVLGEALTAALATVERLTVEAAAKQAEID